MLPAQLPGDLLVGAENLSGELAATTATTPQKTACWEGNMAITNLMWELGAVVPVLSVLFPLPGVASPLYVILQCSENRHLPQ